MKYVSFDGYIFDTERQCKEHEKSSTVAYTRKHYSFIPYGSWYDRMKNDLGWFKRLLRTFEALHPSECVCHDARGLYVYFSMALEVFKKNFSRLPKPTKDQRYPEDGPDPWTPGKWPDEKHTPKIDETIQKWGACRLLAKQAAALIMESGYRTGVLGEKKYKSERECRKSRKGD